MKRTPLRQVSRHRQKINRERRKLQEAEWGPKDEWRCWFRDNPLCMAVAGPCFGEVWGHEILKRTRAGSTDANLLNIKGQVPLCNAHNVWVENSPVEANKMGLADHATN